MHLKRWYGARGWAISLIAILAVASPLRAQDYPSRLIRIVSPHPAGIATDILARAMADKLSASLGQPVVVENRPGANGIVAAGAIARAEPDGYTLHITTGAHIANAFVAKDLPYDVLKDFAPVTLLAAGHPTVFLRAQALGLTGRELPEAVDRNRALRDRIEAIQRYCPLRPDLREVTEYDGVVADAEIVAALLAQARHQQHVVPVQLQQLP